MRRNATFHKIEEALALIATSYAYPTSRINGDLICRIPTDHRYEAEINLSALAKDLQKELER